MGLTMRRPKAPEPAIADAEPVDETWTIPVGVAKALEHLAAPIAEALGPGFRVTVGTKPDHGVALITAQGRSAMAFLRARYPTTLFLVNRHGPSQYSDDAAAHLNAGADGCIESTLPIEIAAHVRALSRRDRT
jgi:hypothetical protein